MDDKSLVVYDNALNSIRDKISSLEFATEYIETNIKVLSMIDKNNKELYNSFLEKIKLTNFNYIDIFNKINNLRNNIDVDKK